MPKPRTIAKSAISHCFERSDRTVYRTRDLVSLIDANRTKWRLPTSMRTTEAVEYLLKNTKLHKAELQLPYRPETRYVWGDVPTVVLALDAKPKSYLTHFSAMWVHELTKQVPKTLYINVEQRPQASFPDSLTQQGIDRAFRNQQRMTTNIAEYQGTRLVYLNGKFTDQLGVIDHHIPSGESVRVTDMERTLIDIAVRPAYSGGVANVAAAYAEALARISATRLSDMLAKMKYVYPYEQAIGFYLERAGAKDSALRLFGKKPFRFKFFLAHGMRDVEFVKRWSLWVPKGF